MLRRSSRSPTALDHSKEELARRESELREKVDKLERMIADAPRVAEEITRQQRDELLQRASEGRSRLDVAVGLQDKRYGDNDGGGGGRRRGAMRKERREGRIVFIVLMILLAVAVIWLISHLQRF